MLGCLPCGLRRSRTPPDGVVTHRGELRKRGPTQLHRYLPRYCELRGRYLVYYESEAHAGRKALGWIDLCGAQLSANNDGPFGFYIVGSSLALARDYALQADSEEAKRTWCRVIVDSISRHTTSENVAALREDVPHRTGTVILAGYITKRSRRVRRPSSVYGELRDGRLFYSDSPVMQSYKAVPLRGAYIREQKRACGFSISASGGGRKYSFEVKDGTECGRWIAALKACRDGRDQHVVSGEELARDPVFGGVTSPPLALSHLKALPPPDGEAPALALRSPPLAASPSVTYAPQTRGRSSSWDRCRESPPVAAAAFTSPSGIPLPDADRDDACSVYTADEGWGDVEKRIFYAAADMVHRVEALCDGAGGSGSEAVRLARMELAAEELRAVVNTLAGNTHNAAAAALMSPTAAALCADLAAERRCLAAPAFTKLHEAGAKAADACRTAARRWRGELSMRQACSTADDLIAGLEDLLTDHFFAQYFAAHGDAQGDRPRPVRVPRNAASSVGLSVSAPSPTNSTLTSCIDNSPARTGRHVQKAFETAVDGLGDWLTGFRVDFGDGAELSETVRAEATEIAEEAAAALERYRDVEAWAAREVSERERKQEARENNAIGEVLRGQAAMLTEITLLRAHPVPTPLTAHRINCLRDAHHMVEAWVDGVGARLGAAAPDAAGLIARIRADLSAAAWVVEPQTSGLV
eukprot:TRINITY_DN33032_c0_g1_i1.p1 TRINITY_DN33032_c0_g1~~TRINITY_DN33032_c0_g1_i1.p1  ORF type:complete len:698 (+),score=143.36 TRINITY_DN33032_c0_g1_i1:31-2124(+)